MADAPASEQSIFLTAIELRSPLERESFLNKACAGDHQLRAEVDELLAAHDRLGTIDSPALTLADDEAIAERPGTVIGPYKLLEQIGEGGFGIVFMAEQERPVSRKVALKVLKPGMDTRQVVARFEAERQALALMDHPHIAHIHDGGTTITGRPYFVMELVRGIPITEYCDQSQLAVPARLELFILVCQAVQHAHSKGVIHRDLKPSNVLVTLHDGAPVPKVIDFGVAKALGQRLTDKTLFTAFAQMVGTPMYMSPEQAELSGLDVDTRSDIYSLGVLLYELLSGTTPFDRDRMRTVGYDEMRRIIREEEPARPSLRLSTQGAAAATVSANRRCEPRKLSRLLRGELDWVVMKCLEKDRTRRYETVDALTKDVGRYLADEPVQACPPSAVYRLKKFARRHRYGLAVAGVLGLALLVTVVVLVFAVATLVDSRGRIARKVQETKKANDELEKALEKQERDLYSLHFTLAQRDWLAGDFGLAREHLAACPARQRDRDWRFLHRLCHLEVFSFGTEDGPVPRLLAYRPDGRCLAATFSDYSLKLWDTATGQEVFARQAGDFKFLSFAFIDSGERLVLFGRKALGPDGKAAINRVRVDVWEPASGTNVHTHTWTSAIKTSSRPETTNQRVASDILSVVHELRVKM